MEENEENQPWRIVTPKKGSRQSLATEKESPGSIYQTGTNPMTLSPAHGPASVTRYRQPLEVSESPLSAECELSQLARKKALELKIRGARIATGESDLKLDSASCDSILLSRYLKSFDWEEHAAKLSSFWVSVVGNPKKFLFSVLSYLEEQMLSPAYGFPSVLFTEGTYLRDLPTSLLTSSDDPDCGSLVDVFQEKIGQPFEAFLRERLDTPEFLTEDVFEGLLESLVSNRSFRQGRCSFGGIFLLSRLVRIFPFNCFLSLRTGRQRSDRFCVTLAGQQYFFLWLLSFIFDEEPSQSLSVLDLLLEDLTGSDTWNRVPAQLVQHSVLLMEDLAQHSLQMSGSDEALLQLQTKIVSFLNGCSFTSTTVNERKNQRMLVTDIMRLCFSSLRNNALPDLVSLCVMRYAFVERSSTVLGG